jgi:diguanylate cyclase (GGDEF)-like protein
VGSENLEKILLLDTAPIENRTALRRLVDYLKSVRGKFIDYEELMVVDGQGELVATSYDQKTPVLLPQDWLKLALAGKSVIGQPSWDETLKAGVMVAAEPIVSTHERFLGVLVAKLNFRSITGMLQNYAQNQVGELYLITKEGVVLTSSEPLASGFMEVNLLRSVYARLYSREGNTLDYRNFRGPAVVGTLKKVPQLEWGVVAEENRAEAYAQIFRLRNLTMAFVAGLLFLIGLAAYLLGLTIVRPLDRLIGGAAKVAAGDLEVDLPITTHGELGYMTEVFNNMVTRLREGREQLATINETLRKKNLELHEISITDSLTGLYNRKHLMETLDKETSRCQRYKRPLAILMIDIDHFKRYNDTFGHLAGDGALKRMAKIFRDSVRAVDYSARYGGEEFLIILPETSKHEAAKAAERIRRCVEEDSLAEGDKATATTVSIGVAIFPEHGDDIQTLIKNADAALYEAKEGGRNQVVTYQSKPKKKRRQAAGK